MKITTKLFVIVGLACFAGLSLFTTNVQADTCVSHTSKQCISNIVYWYNSCGALEGIYQNCNNSNQICQNAQCVDKTPAPAPTPSPTPTTTQHDVKSCYNGDLHWFSSAGTPNDLYQSCKDSNSCTQDDCAGNKCVNELKCDGSTCAAGSPDYITYCANSPATTATTAQTQTQNLAISLFVKKDGSGTDWQRTMDVAANDKLDFLIMVKNISASPIDNVLVKTDLTNNISYTGNLKIAAVDSAGNLATGIDLGTLAPKAAQVLSFTGTVAAQAPAGPLQISTNANVGTALVDSDYVILTTTTTATPATTVKAATSGNSLLDNLKKNWYIWLIILIVLIVVFIIIFRRLSTNP